MGERDAVQADEVSALLALVPADRDPTARDQRREEEHKPVSGLGDGDDDDAGNDTARRAVLDAKTTPLPAALPPHAAMPAGLAAPTAAVGEILQRV